MEEHGFSQDELNELIRQSELSYIQDQKKRNELNLERERIRLQEYKIRSKRVPPTPKSSYFESTRAVKPLPSPKVYNIPYSPYKTPYADRANARRRAANKRINYRNSNG